MELSAAAIWVALKAKTLAMEPVLLFEKMIHIYVICSTKPLFFHEKMAVIRKFPKSTLDAMCTNPMNKNFFIRFSARVHEIYKKRLDLKTSGTGPNFSFIPGFTGLLCVRFFVV